MILGSLEGGRRTRRTLTTDNASKIFILKSITAAAEEPRVLEKDDTNALEPCIDRNAGLRQEHRRRDPREEDITQLRGYRRAYSDVTTTDIAGHY